MRYLVSAYWSTPTWGYGADVTRNGRLDSTRGRGYWWKSRRRAEAMAQRIREEHPDKTVRVESCCDYGANLASGCWLDKDHD